MYPRALVAPIDGWVGVANDAYCGLRHGFGGLFRDFEQRQWRAPPCTFPLDCVTPVNANEMKAPKGRGRLGGLDSSIMIMIMITFGR
jgi:hypothetical protein